MPVLTRRAALLGLGARHVTLGPVSLALAAGHRTALRRRDPARRPGRACRRGADGDPDSLGCGAGCCRSTGSGGRAAGPRRLLWPASVAGQPPRHVPGGRASARACRRRTARVRSHFEAQDCLESGADHRMTSGWLNRAVAGHAGWTGDRPGGDAWAIGCLCVRCCCAVRPRWATGRPMASSRPRPDLYTQIAALNQADGVTGPAIAEGLRERGFTVRS